MFGCIDLVAECDVGDNFRKTTSQTQFVPVIADHVSCFIGDMSLGIPGVGMPQGPRLSSG